MRYERAAQHLSYCLPYIVFPPAFFRRCRTSFSSFPSTSISRVGGMKIEMSVVKVAIIFFFYPFLALLLSTHRLPVRQPSHRCNLHYATTSFLLSFSASYPISLLLSTARISTAMVRRFLSYWCWRFRVTC